MYFKFPRCFSTYFWSDRNSPQNFAFEFCMRCYWSFLLILEWCVRMYASLFSTNVISRHFVSYDANYLIMWATPFSYIIILHGKLKHGTDWTIPTTVWLKVLIVSLKCWTKDILYVWFQKWQFDHNLSSYIRHVMIQVLCILILYELWIYAYAIKCQENHISSINSRHTKECEEYLYSVPIWRWQLAWLHITSFVPVSDIYLSYALL